MRFQINIFIGVSLDGEFKMSYMISYLTCGKWHDYDLNQRPEHQGFGGGMAVKTQRVVEALGRQYYTQLTDNIEDIDAPVVVVEPLWFKLFEEDKSIHWEKITELGKLADTKTLILMCSEFELMRWEAPFRDGVVNTFDKITCNCQYQANIFSYHDIVPDGIVCDPIPIDVFMPPHEPVKENSIVATGHVSWIKNIEKVIETFKRFQDKGISTTYIGSANLWGKPDKNDPSLQLEAELRSVTDNFNPSLSQVEVARTLQKNKFGLWMSTHECFGQGYAEKMATGQPVIAGKHGLKAERHCSDTADDIDLMIADEEKYSAVSTWNRQWVKDNLSYEVFLKQFAGVLRK